MTMGKNTISNEKMMGFVQRVEDRERAKKVISDEIALIYAEAKADNLSTPGIRGVVKARKMKPSQFRESEDLRDVYFHAAGLLEEPPLFRSIEALAGDDMSKSAIIDRFAKLVPASGSIIVEMDGPPVRLTRGKDGVVKMEEVQPPKPNGGGAHAPAAPGRPQADVPDCTPAEAEKMGAAAFDDDQPITANPFPFGDKRQPKWDAGWRKKSGSDGMGPDTGGHP